MKRPKKTHIEYMCNGGIPLDSSGTHLLPKLPNKELCDKFLAEKKLSEDLLREHFSDMFIKFLENLAKKDY
jgi:hypothetical protein